jgi:hypothetical protein
MIFSTPLVMTVKTLLLGTDSYTDNISSTTRRSWFYLLPKAAWSGWAAILTFDNALLLYFPWAIAIAGTRRLMISPLTVVGFFMIAVGLFLMITALPLIIRVPGQLRSFPESWW